MSDTTKYPLLLNGDTRDDIGFIEIFDSTVNDIANAGVDVEITPMIHPGTNTSRPGTNTSRPGIISWSLNVVPSIKKEEVRYIELKAPEVTRLIDDDRPITMLTFPFQEAEQPGLTVGCKLFGQEVTRIRAYEEAGEMAMVLWFAVYGYKQRADTELQDRGIGAFAEEIIYRIQGKYVESIGYQEEGKAK